MPSAQKVDSGFDIPLIHTLRYVGYTVRPPSGSHDGEES